MIEQDQPNDGSITVLIHGISLQSSAQTNQQTIYNVVGQSSNGQIIYGVSHTGVLDNWNDNFAININDLSHVQLNLIVFINDNQFGEGKLNFADILQANTGSQINQQLQLKSSGNVVGYLNLDIMKSRRQEVIGGLHPPVISLKNGQVYVQPVRQPQAGLQKVRVKKLNCFSCMDANDLDWQFMPYNFQTKLRPTYSDH